MDPNSPAFCGGYEEVLISGDPAQSPVKIECQSSGMTLRTYIATKAMAGMIASCYSFDENMDPGDMAKWAVKYADALIAELSKS